MARQIAILARHFLCILSIGVRASLQPASRTTVRLRVDQSGLLSWGADGSSLPKANRERANRINGYSLHPRVCCVLPFNGLSYRGI